VGCWILRIPVGVVQEGAPAHALLDLDACAREAQAARLLCEPCLLGQEGVEELICCPRPPRSPRPAGCRCRWCVCAV
jgi:hypothetical protein